MDDGGDSPCWAARVCEACGALAETHTCPRVRPVLRRIDGFHQDPAGDWVAELSCLHIQHVRHRPPMQARPWVLTADGRAAHIATDIECPPCARAELPEGLILARTAGPFDADSVPPAFLTDHVIAAGRWGRLHVHSGTIVLRMDTDPPTTVSLRAGECQAIPPALPHRLVRDGPVLLTLDFLIAAPPGPPTSTTSGAAGPGRNRS